MLHALAGLPPVVGEAGPAFICSQEGQTISHKTAGLVERLPGAVEQTAIHLPGQAERVVTSDVASTITGVGSSITTFGQSLLTGTQELIDQASLLPPMP